MKYFKVYSIIILFLFVAGGDYIDALFVLPVFLTLWLNKGPVTKKENDEKIVIENSYSLR